MKEIISDPSAVVAQMSNLCLPQRAAVTYGVEGHRKILEEINDASMNSPVENGPGCRGYTGGYEITPTRALVASLRFTALQGHETDLFGNDPLYSSVHQGWAGNNVYGLVMQRNIPSIKVAERLSEGRMDAVLFGDTRHNGKPVSFADYRFTHPGMQFTADVFDDWNLHGNDPGTYDAIPERMEERGLKKAVIDPFHLYRAHLKDHTQRINPEWVLKSLQANNIPMDRVHLQAGGKIHGTEEDFEQTEKDLDALLESPESFQRSRMGELVIAAFKIWQLQHAQRLEGINDNFHFVNEVTDKALRHYHHKTQPKTVPYDRKAFVGYHARMIRHARKTLADARK